jgi:hypothetical protein
LRGKLQEYLAKVELSGCVGPALLR